MFLELKQLTSTFIYGVQPFSDEYALYEKCNHLLMKEERELEYPGKKIPDDELKNSAHWLHSSKWYSDSDYSFVHRSLDKKVSTLTHHHSLLTFITKLSSACKEI